MNDWVKTESDGGIFKITLDRADKLNALTDSMYAALNQALAEAESNDKVKVIMLQSSSKHFCAGNDLADFLQTPFNLESQVVRFLRNLARLQKPLVVAVSGAVVGIGLTMLLHADVVVAASNSKLSVPFIKLGLTPEGGSTKLLARRVGEAVARDWLFTGRTFDGNEAMRAGLVSQLAEDADKSRETALAIAQEMAAYSGELLKTTKQLLNEADKQEIVAAINREAEVFAMRLKSDEAQAAFKAFLQRS